MDLYDEPEPADEEERADLLERLRAALAEIEIERHSLHERIDLVQDERLRRLRALRGAGALVVDTRQPPRDRIFTGSGELASPPPAGLPDLERLDRGGLRRLFRRLQAREDDVSLQRRILHARIDALLG